MEHQSVDKANNKNHQNETQPAARPETHIQTPVYPIQHLHQTVGNMAIGHLIQRKSKVNQPGDTYEQEADQISDQVMSSDFGNTTETTTKSTQTTHTNTTVQKLAKAETTDSTVDANSSPVPAEPVAEIDTPIETPSQAMIVDDSAEQLMPGQMRKSEFLDQLYDDVCNTANEILSGTGRSTEGCPYLDYWFGYYRNQDGQHIERAVNKYAPESARVTSAQEYIPLIASRVGSAVATWATTGEITGVPEGVPGMGILSGIGSIFFKGREGGARGASNPQAIQSQLGTGSSLDSGVRSRIESTFGVGLSHVRVHTDSNAARLSDGLNARAFTVGKDIAFGSGEYQPGTPMGDALIAHELAHVVQQGDGKSSESKLNDEITNQPLEEDADKSAIGAIASIWGGAKETMKNITNNAIPRMRSGLQLSRCSKKEPEPTPTKTAPAGSGSSAGAKKTLTLNISKLEGSTRSTVVNDASKILEDAANITISNGNVETVNSADSKALIGNDLILDEYTSAGNATAEEIALTARNRTSGVITAYFVKALSHGSHGESFWPSGFPRIPSSVAIKNDDAPFVSGKPLAHELGHLLLDKGDHSSDNTNLMSYDHTGVGLTSTEATTARSSSFVK